MLNIVQRPTVQDCWTRVNAHIDAVICCYCCYLFFLYGSVHLCVSFIVHKLSNGQLPSCFVKWIPLNFLLDEFSQMWSDTHWFCCPHCIITSIVFGLVDKSVGIPFEVPDTNQRQVTHKFHTTKKPFQIWKCTLLWLVCLLPCNLME